MTPGQDFFPSVLNRLSDLSGAQAVALLEGVAESHPGDPRPWLLLGGIQAEAKAWDRAEAAYSNALLRAPGFAIARFQLGLLQLTLGRPASAMATWAPLEELIESHPIRLFAQAFVSLIQERPDQAVHQLKEGLLRNTDNLPLSKDMQGVLDRIQKALVAESSALQSSSEAGAGSPPEGTVRSEIPVQFLISAYKQVE